MDRELTELEELESIYCDMHKDVYGVKARWYKAESIEQARADIDRLQVELKEQMARDAIFQQEAATAFEARMKDVIFCGAKDRETALRWIHDAEGTGGDNEYLAYKLGLKYGYFHKEVDQSTQVTA